MLPSQKINYTILSFERMFSNTRGHTSKFGVVYKDVRKSPNIFPRRLRIPAARGPLFEDLLMQRARVLKISTLQASEKEKRSILKIHYTPQRDIYRPYLQLQRGHPYNTDGK